MALISRNAEQADGWKIEIALSADEIAQVVLNGRWTFLAGQDLEQIHGRKVAELIVNAGP